MSLVYTYFYSEIFTDTTIAHTYINKQGLYRKPSMSLYIYGEIDDTMTLCVW